jgi:hypothetical protein
MLPHRSLLAFLSTLLMAVSAFTAQAQYLQSGLQPGDVAARRYRDYVRECLDILIDKGTDRYGQTQSPLLVNILDVRNQDCPRNPLPLDEEFRVSRRERRGPAGGNLYADQRTLRTMQILSQVTGDPRYAAFARECIAYTLRNLVDDKGLIWWGWHRHYDVFEDKMTGHLGNPHEIHVQEALWPMLWEVDRAAVTREIEALWEWHVIDKNTGEVNRHGDRQRGCDFAMSAGEILGGFAFLYQQTRESKWLERTRLVAGYHWSQRNLQTNLTPDRPNAGRDRFDGSHFTTSITGLYCHRLLAAADLTGDAVLREYAVAYLKAYAQYGFDTQMQTFWGSLRLDGTPVPGPRVSGNYAQYEPRGHVDLWQPYAAGYEQPIATAQAYACAYASARDETLLTAAQRWADLIRREFPPTRCDTHGWYRQYAVEWAPAGTHAGNYGGAISFLLHLHRLTSNEEWLSLAKTVANEAVARLYYRGLLRGHPGKPYYESLDGVGVLLYALLQLDAVLVPSPASTMPWYNW